MTEWIGSIIAVLLGVIGVTEVIRSIVLWICSPGRERKMVIVIPITGHDEEVELVLRSAAQRVKWMGGKDEKQILCVDYGMDTETRAVCEKLCREYLFLSVIGAEDLDAYFGIRSEKIP